MVWGLSQGSFWATQMAAAEARFAASAVLFTCFDPGNEAMFSTQSPTFTQRFMYMTGTSSEEALHKVTQRMSVAGLGNAMAMPSLVIAGEDDPLTDPAQTFAHFDAISGPKELLFYVGEGHAPVTRSSGQLGPVVYNYPADWLADRAAGVPLQSQIITIDARGERHLEPWTPGRTYSYGAPLDTDVLFTGAPPLMNPRNA